MSERHKDLLVCSLFFLYSPSRIQFVVSQIYRQRPYHSDWEHHVTGQTFLKIPERLGWDRPAQDMMMRGIPMW
jgi:hypothetical protein